MIVEGIASFLRRLSAREAKPAVRRFDPYDFFPHWRMKMKAHLFSSMFWDDYYLLKLQLDLQGYWVLG